MAKDVLITPTDGLIQFSSSVGSGSGQIKVDGDDLVISNLVGDVLLGDGASDIFVGDGTNNVDIVFEQNGEIRDDGSGKNLTIGSKTTNVFVTGSSSLILQKQGGSVGLGTVTTDSLLHISGAAVSENLFHIEGSDGIDALFATGSGRIGIGTTSPSTLLHIKQSITNNSDNSLMTIHGDVSDLGTEKVLIDFTMTDTNANNYPQVKIGAAVGQDGDADSQGKEGSGAFVVYTSPGSSTSDGEDNTAERMRVNYLGHIGINTTTPSNALHISTGSGNNLTPALRLNKLVDDDGSSDGGTATGILMGAVSAGSAKTGIFSENAGAGNGRQNLIFAMDTTADTSDADLSDERMRITHDGKVGIGTTAPTTLLQVAGDISASGNIFLGAMGATFISMSSADGLVSASFFSGSFGGDGSGLTGVTSTVDIDGLGALGGTGIAQSDKLMFSDDGTEKSITFSNLEDAIFGNVSGDATVAAGGALTIAANSVEGTMLNTNAADTSTMELSSDSLSVLKVPNVLTAGVGITAAGTFDGAAARTFSVDSASFAPFFSASMNDLDVQGNISGSLGSTGSFGRLHTSGRVGVGTLSPSMELEVVAGANGGILVNRDNTAAYSPVEIGFRHTTSEGDAALGMRSYRTNEDDSYDHELRFFTTDGVDGQAEHLTIKHTGNVGVGTTGPSASLDVAGDLRVSSHITASGNISSSGTLTSDGLNSSAAVLPVTSNGAALGSTSLQWSDLFLASGGVINFNNGDITLTHSATAQQLKLNGGSLNVNGNITASGDISSSLASTGSFGALHTTGDISGSGTGSFSNIKVSNMPAGADNSVVILDSDGFLKTDEVDSRIFDGTNLLGAQDAPTDGYFLISDDGRSLADSIVNQDNSNIGIGNAAAKNKLTVAGEISSSGGFIGGATQNTGSYDFPGAIMGYTNIGSNSGHASYTITTSYAVPDSEMNVIFVVPKSGKVEIMVQVQVKDNSFSADTVNCALSDSATYNTIGAQHEVSAFNQDETGTDIKTIRWSIEGLTAGATLQYWFAVQNNIGASGQSLQWGGSGTGRFPDFIMKVTALPSNALFL